MDAKADIWVGVKIEDTEQWDEVFLKLPESIKDDEGDLHWDDSVIRKSVGVKLATISCSEEIIGFGVPIFQHDWEYGVVEIDFRDLMSEESFAKQKLLELFQAWGIDLEVKTFIQTDYR